MEKLIELLLDKSVALREAGVSELRLDGVQVIFTPATPATASQFSTPTPSKSFEAEAIMSGDPLMDPSTFGFDDGRERPPGFTRPEVNDGME